MLIHVNFWLNLEMYPANYLLSFLEWIVEVRIIIIPEYLYLVVNNKFNLKLVHQILNLSLERRVN